jgi:dienelactone hydrolase
MDTVRTENVVLQVADATTMTAFVATPADGGKLPGLIVFQEAFGVNPHIRDVTQRFAKQGYVAIAPELFHRSGPGFEGAYNNFPACLPHMQALTPEGLINDAKAAFDWLQNSPRVLPNRTARKRRFRFTEEAWLRLCSLAPRRSTRPCSFSGVVSTATSRRSKFVP